ncbi:MAG: hypothetical protein PHX61_03595 [Alphaproteobacteria bacterium]|nr:hypothetical protein [Alphaproteobacteria bacterium]OIN87520.1 MAG: hypothetical protein AUJ12_01980 [Alphaproteobacteria bacterium CG1_02_46_17]
MGDLFNYSPVDLSPDDFWSLIGGFAFLVGLKLAADDSPHLPSYYGLIFSLSSGMFVFWVRYYH